MLFNAGEKVGQAVNLGLGTSKWVARTALQATLDKLMDTDGAEARRQHEQEQVTIIDVQRGMVNTVGDLAGLIPRVNEKDRPRYEDMLLMLAMCGQVVGVQPNVLEYGELGVPLDRATLIEQLARPILEPPHPPGPPGQHGYL